MTSLILLSEFQKSQVEFWRPIPSFPRYDVSSFGRVRSFKYKHDAKTPRMLKPGINSTGYLALNLSQSKERRSMLVHRLVVMAFLPNPLSLPDVNHLTALRSDSRLDNLEWSSKSHNLQHSWDIGIRQTRAGTANGKAKLTDKQVREIRRRRAMGEKLWSIAGDYGITDTSVAFIATRRTWKHVI